MAALDNLTSDFMPGERVAPTDAPLSSSSDYIKVPGTKKGSSAIMDINSSEQILQKMQDFIEQRKGDQSTLGGVANALADASMYLYHPEVYAQQQKQKDEKQKDIFDAQMEMAQYKAAIANQKAYQDRVKALMGGTASGGDTVVGGAGKRFAFNQLPPEIQASALAQPDSASFQKVIDDWAKEHAKQTYAATSGFEYNPASQKQEPFTFNTPNGVIQVDLTPFQAKQAQAAGKLPDGTPILPAGSGIAPVPAPQAAAPMAAASTGITPSNIAKVESGNRPFAEGPLVPGQGTAKSAMQVMDATSMDPGFGVKPAQLTGDKAHDEAERVRVGTDYFNALKGKYGDTLGALAYNWGPGNVDAWIASGADISKLPPEAKDYVAKAHIASAVANIPAAKATPAAEPAATPAAAPTTVGANEQRVAAKWAASPPKNSGEFKQRDEQLKDARTQDYKLAQNVQGAKLKQTEQETTGAGKRLAKIATEAGKVDDVVQQADRIISHATKHPEEFGWSYESGPTGVALNTLGLLPQFHGFNAEQAGEKLLQSFKGHDVAERRANTNSDASKLGFDFAAQTFAGTGARLGVGLEQMASKAKSLGAEYPAETNVLNAKIIKYAYQRAADVNSAWEKYKAANPQAEAGQFEQTPEYKAINQKWNNAADSLLPQYLKLEPEAFSKPGNAKRPLSSFHK